MTLISIETEKVLFPPDFDEKGWELRFRVWFWSLAFTFIKEVQTQKKQLNRSGVETSFTVEPGLEEE